LKCKEAGSEGVLLIALVQNVDKWAGCYKHEYEASDSTKCREFLD